MDTRTGIYSDRSSDLGEPRVRDALYRGKVHKMYADEPFPPARGADTIFAVFDRASGVFTCLVPGDAALRDLAGTFGQSLPQSSNASCDPDDPLRQAWATLREEPLGMLPVVDARGVFQGIITRDSAVEALLDLTAASPRRNPAVGAAPSGAMHEAARSLLQTLGHIEDEELLARRGLRLLMTLLDAHYGAISIMDEHGTLRRFIHDGLSETQAKRIGHLPEGRGLLGVALIEGETLRVEDIRRDPRSAGFPPHHPAMTALLAVPIAHRGETVGRLYLCDRYDGLPFGKADEALARTFADQLALMTLSERHRQAMRDAQAETATLLAENRQLARRLLATQEEERRYLARELHNEVAQYLTAMRAEAQRLILLADTAFPIIREGAQALASLCERTHDLAHEVLRGLAPTLVYEAGLADALRELTSSFERHHPGIRFRLALAGDLENLPAQVAITAYRVVQEALTNAARHAEPTRLFVGVRRRDSSNGALRVSVRDNGRGFDPQATTNTVGLVGMRERVQALDGALKVSSRLDGGTRIEARIPVPGSGEVQ